MKLAHTVSLTATFIALGLSLNAPTAAATPPAAETQPNVVVILTDDQDMDSLPVMRHLMSYPEGSWVQFSNAFTNVSLCSPSRVTLLTGQYAHDHTIVANHGSFDETNTLPVWLDDAGYDTAIMGKYLNSRRPNPRTPGWDTIYDTGKGKEIVDNYSNAAVKFIEDTEGPFFLYLSYPAPHLVAKPPTRYRRADVYVPPWRPNVNEADISDKPNSISRLPLLTATQLREWQQERTNSQRELLAIDDGVQLVMDALKARGVLDDTLIIFTADNGFSWGSHRYTTKHCPYDECNQVPLLIRYPGATNRVESRLVSNVDLTATISDFAGVTPGLTLDGRSLVPLLENSAGDWPEAVLLERHEGPYYGVRTPGWTYVEYATGEKELYDLAADPYQMQNVAGQPQYAGTEATLARQLRRLLDGHAISGRVTTAGGQPVEGVLVSAAPDLSAITDADGRYALEGLPSGSYSLTATRNGYRFNPLGPIVVPPGGRDKDFVGEFIGFTISGVVTTENGQPLAGVTITDGQGHQATTAGDGAYALPRLSPGDFSLTPSLAGYAFTPASLAVTITDNDVGGQNFAARLLTYTISGVVTLDGSPLAGVAVSAGGGRQTTTDAGGGFIFSDLLVGNYTVTPSLFGYAFAPTSRTVTVSDSDVGGLAFAATLLTYDVSGSVSLNGSPMAGVTVSAGDGRQTTTDATGVYRFLDLLPGSYTLTPSRAGYIFAPTSRAVTVTDADVSGQNFAGTLLVYDVSGSVTVGGSPLAGVTISAGNGRQATTNAAGAFVLLDLPPGTYTLTPARAGYSFAPASLEVTVNNQDVGGQNFVATLLTYAVSGVVTLEGSPLAGVAVSAGGGRQTATDAEGAFRFADLLPGSYTVTPSLFGYSFAPTSRAVTLSNADVGGLAFAATLLTYDISGSVSLNGSPMAGVTVSAGDGRQTTTDASGAYRFLDLLPGSYTLTPSLAGYVFAPASRTVTLSTADVNGQHFAATLLTYDVSGFVTVNGNPLAGVTVSAGNGRQATTNAAGAYVLPDLPPGTYTLTPSRAGYAFEPSSLTVTVTDSDVGGQDFAATLLLYTISGAVSLNGSPMAGVTVSAGNGRQTTTDAEGMFSFTDLPVGTYTLTPSYAGYAFTPASRTVTLSNGDVGGQAFAATLLTYDISGSVTLNGSPLAGVVVSAGNGHQATTDANGAYTFPDLLPGTYTLTATRAGYSFAPASRTVTVTNANVSGQNFAATLLTYSISGVTTVNGITRSGMVIADGQGRKVTSGTGGVYLFSGFTPGTYRLTPFWRGVKYDQYSLVVTITDSDLSGQNIAIIMR